MQRAGGVFECQNVDARRRACFVVVLNRLFCGVSEDCEGRCDGVRKEGVNAVEDVRTKLASFGQKNDPPQAKTDPVTRL